MESLLVIGAVTASAWLLCVVWKWFLALWRKGIRAAFGKQKIVVGPFENAALYLRGVFVEVLLPGVHWIPREDCQVYRVEMRAEVVGGQVLVHPLVGPPIHVVWSARVQATSPQLVIESTNSQGAEVFHRVQSSVKTVCTMLSSHAILTELVAMETGVVEKASDLLGEIGYTCLAFEVVSAQMVADVGEPEEIEFVRH